MHVSSVPLILEGRQPSLLRKYWRAVRYPLEAASSLSSTTFQIPCQAHRPLPSIAAIPVCCLDFCGHLRNRGTTICCDHLTSAQISTSPFRYHILPLHQQWPDQDHHLAHMMHVLLLLLHHCLPL